MTYSLDFRKRVLAAKEDDGLTYEQTALHFKAGVDSHSLESAYSAENPTR